MMRTITAMACAGLLLGAACKKETKDKATEKTPEATDPAAGKTTDTAETPATDPNKPKLDTPEDKVAFYKACTAHLNAKDWEKFGLCYVEDAVWEQLDSGSPPSNGRAAIVDNSKNFDSGFPDFQVTPTHILTAGNKIASVSVVNGTNSAPMKVEDGELPPTKKKIGIQRLTIWELDPARGGIAKEWFFIDTGTFVGQLGLSDQPHRPAVAKPTGEPQVVTAKNDPAEKANLDLYNKGVEAWNKHDAKALDAMMDDKAVSHDIGGPKDMDKKKSSAFAAEILKAFPDSKTEVVDAWAAGDYVVAVVKNTGTNKGPMPSMGLKKPTGKPLSFTSGDIIRYQGGKAVESWSFYNGVAIATQLGMTGDK